MNADTLLENFEILAEAPGGIHHFRELTLQLATNGKLLNSSARKTNPATGLPETWMLKPFNEVAQFAMGKTPPTKNPDFWGGVNSTMWVSIGDMQDGQTIKESSKTVSLKAGSEVFRREPWPEGTLLMSFKLTIGKMARLGRPSFFNEAIFAFDAGNEITNEYLFRVLPVISRSANSKGAIKGNTLNSESISQMRVPVPPLLEQERIVAKVDELMALCDQLEEQQKQRDNLRTATRKSAIDAISTATTPEELETAWRRISNNWEVIADTPESIESIRNLINNLAVRGRLSKTEKDEKPIGVPILEGPFDLPPNWRWTRIEDVSNFVNGYAFPSGDYKEKGVGVVRMSDMKNGKIITSRMKFVSEKYFDELSASFRVSPGDLVMGMTGATLGKPCFNLTSSTFLLNQRIGKFEPFAVDVKYLGIALLTLERLFMEVSFGTGVNNLSTKQIKESVFPIPPLEEQKRIVAKVDQLMTLCDQIEMGLESRSGKAEKFARSVVNVA